MKSALIISVLAALLLAAAPCRAQKLFQNRARVGEDHFVPGFESFRAKRIELGYTDGKNVRYRQGAKLVNMILRGAKPTELPIELPHKFQLAVNLSTARAIGLKPSKEISLRADELIE